MSDKKQLSHMSQFSIVRESPGESSKLHEKSITKKQPQQQKTSELKFKIEPIGIQPEDDDDLESCPSRTRTSWPHQIIPWWKPADRFEKPPYSYATLIAHAILTSKDGRLTLSDIYKWISEAYPYYKRGEKGWQNSIRHNLSLNKKWFVKVDRRPTQAHPGKGGYWTLQMNMEKIFVDNLSQAGGHSRRHHDMGMYGSLSTQYYRSSSASSEELQNDETSVNNMFPNILITVPGDYEAKKTKSTSPSNAISAPRIRNLTSQEKSALSSTTTTPKMDPKNFTIRFPSTSSDLKRRKSSDPPRPAPKPGKKHNPVEPGSSTSEDREDSAVEIGDEHTTKKRKSTTIDTMAASPTLSYPTVSYNPIRPEDVIGTMSFNSDFNPNFSSGFPDTFNNDFDLWMFEPEIAPSTMLLTTGFPLPGDDEAQNILDGLQSTTFTPQEPVSQHHDMKTVNLQFDAFDKTIHYPSVFPTEQFSDINSGMYVSEIGSYNMEQYIDLNGNTMMDTTTQPSDLLLEDEALTNSYWNDTTNTCYMNFDLNPMPFAVKHDK